MQMGRGASSQQHKDTHFKKTAALKKEKKLHAYSFYLLHLFLPLSPAKLHSYAQRNSITVAVPQLFTSHSIFYLERQSSCTFNRQPFCYPSSVKDHCECVSWRRWQHVSLHKIKLLHQSDRPWILLPNGC